METVNYLLPIRSYEIDRYGYVPGHVYMQWMELGWTELLRAIGFPGYGLDEKPTVRPHLVSAEIVHKRRLMQGDTVNVELWLSRLNNFSLRIEYRFYNENGALAVEAREEIVLVDGPNARGPRKFTAEERNSLKPLLESSSAERRRHERVPVDPNAENVAKIQIDGQNYPVIIYDESVGGVGAVSVNRLPIENDQIVLFEREDRHVRARISYLREVKQRDIHAFRFGLEWMEDVVWVPDEEHS